jgi:pyrimidine-nucleoside phosphorylase
VAFRAVDIIEKTRDNQELTQAELAFFCQGYVNGEIPDYQMSAWLMAVYFNGLSKANLMQLVEEMVHSGDTLDLSSIEGVTVDKHSTGGVGDKTSLVVSPLVAACGVTIAKMSGRGLGHTGGTIDKLESIPGFQTGLTTKEFLTALQEHKVAIVGQTKNMVALDKMFYALRDVTATVPSIPLIAASIMSKKLASGADAIVLDVKVGNGSFMNDLDQARELARTMVEIGNHFGKTTIAELTDMNQPLGFAVGNALEVEEAINTLLGKGPKDFTELCITLATSVCEVAGIANARDVVEEALQSGKAYERFQTFVTYQGGDLAAFAKRAPAPVITQVLATTSGMIAAFDTKEVGRSAMLLGAGRQTKDDVIDMAVGILVHGKIGERVQAGDVLYTVHANKRNLEVETMLLDTVTIADKATPNRLIYEVIR